MRKKRKKKFKLSRGLMISLAVIAGFILLIEVQLNIMQGSLHQNARYLQEADGVISGLHQDLARERQETRQLRQQVSRVDRYLADDAVRTSEELRQLSRDFSALNDQISETDQDFKEQANKIFNQLNRNYFSALDNRQKLSRLKQKVVPDKDEMLRQIILPSVRIKTPDGVGGGTIIYSQPDKDKQYHTYVMTAYHVIQSLIESEEVEEKRNEVDLKVYPGRTTEMVSYQADIISYNKDKDLALLKVKSDEKFEHQARFIDREEVKSIDIFAPVYALGCPLGYEPIPSFGQITNLRRELNGEKFWMMSAPTIFGNSGGGVFLAETGEYIGVSSMISVYVNFVSIPVTHLGLMVTPESIFDWLDEQYFQFLYDQDFTREGCERIRARFKNADPVLAVTRE
ncbi:MAG: trypsin-like peptidase domain-containing protein [Planctomycetes bacterium]|nr:trypsin-like peptidase domain-containing protein [Planctomycetota bacterium]